MNEVSAGPANFENVLTEFDRAFVEGRLDDLVSFFTDDARALFHLNEALIGKEAIYEAFKSVLDAFDTSSYEPDYEILDVLGDHAYALLTFKEVLRPKDGTAGVRVHGRAVHFWRYGQDAGWQLAALLTARSAPDESES